jgi:hypothetical protein
VDAAERSVAKCSYHAIIVLTGGRIFHYQQA